MARTPRIGNGEDRSVRHFAGDAKREGPRRNLTKKKLQKEDYFEQIFDIYI